MANNNCSVCDTTAAVNQKVKIEPVCAFNCGCIGYGYVPVQDLEDVYDTNKAICQGTVFPELDLSINEYGKICKSWGGTLDD